MKNILIIIMLSYGFPSFGQIFDFDKINKNILEQLDRMGLDKSPVLDSCESAYFNEIFKGRVKSFDFTNKKVVFLMAGRKSDKQEYFREEKERFYEKKTPISSTLYVFNATQKKESGGFDAAILCWSKFIIPTEKVIEKLQKNNQR